MVYHKHSLNDEESSEGMTLDDAIDKMGFGWFQIKLLFLAGFCWMCESMEMMLLSVISPTLQCVWQLQGVWVASITTAVFIGMTIGAVSWGIFSDKYGRRWSVIISTMITFVFGLGSSFSNNIITMIILRGLVGFGVGGGHTAFTLFAEYLPRSNRAVCLVLIEVFWTIGTLGEAGLGWYLLPKGQWRWLLIISSLPLGLLLLLSTFIPESAKYLMTKGLCSEAMVLVSQIARDNNKPLPCKYLISSNGTATATGGGGSGGGKQQGNNKEDVDGADGVDGANVVVSSSNSSSNRSVRQNIMDLFCPSLRKTTMLLLIIWFANAFVYYGLVLTSTQLFQQQASHMRCSNGKLFGPFSNGGMHTSATELCTPMTSSDYSQIFITAAAEFPGILITLGIIDYVGRKKTQGFEFLVVSVFSLLVTMCVPEWTETLFLFVSRALITGAFQASYVYTPEVYPTSVRSTALGICSTMARVGGMLTPYGAQVLLNVSDYLTLALYSIISAVAGICSLLLPIETSGRDLPDNINEISSSSETKKQSEEKMVGRESGEQDGAGRETTPLLSKA